MTWRDNGFIRVSYTCDIIGPDGDMRIEANREAEVPVGKDPKLVMMDILQLSHNSLMRQLG